MKKKRNHHTIPDKSYLSNFIDSEGFNWILNDQDKIFRQKPDKLFRSSYFYKINIPGHGGSLIVEDTLANIESRYLAIYRNKISQRRPIAPEEKLVVATFVAAMMQRTEASRNRFLGMFEQLRDFIQEWKRTPVTEEMKRVLDATPSSGRTITEDEVLGVIDGIDDFHSSSLIDTLPRIATSIFNMKWAFLRPDQDETFLSSDDPLALLRPESIRKYGPRALGSLPGLLYTDTELTLPLAQDCLLLAGYKLDFDLRYIPAESEMVNQLNRRTVGHADKRIIASTEAQLQRVLRAHAGESVMV